SVVVILDIAPLVRRQSAGPREVEPMPAVEARKVPLVMVVDDSVTMRKVTGRVLERHNFEVGTAKDGVDALERMAERVPDLMLLDIEMPRMDGYELATQMKADPRLRDVPIIMITSRTGEKHRQRALELGVQRGVGTPYQGHALPRNACEPSAAQGRLRAGDADEGRSAPARRADHQDHLAQRREAPPARAGARRAALPRQALPGGRAAAQRVRAVGGGRDGGSGAGQWLRPRG